LNVDLIKHELLEHQKMQPQSQSMLRPGDVLLCRGDGVFDITRRVIASKTGSQYTHAAIYVGEKMVLEAVRPRVQKVLLDVLLKRYAHIAVFRQPDAWTPDRIQALAMFANQSVIAKARYNLSGALNIFDAKADHQNTLYERLDAYFKDPKTVPWSEKEEYFCSEIVVDCYIAVGFIEPSAISVYQGHTYAPGDLADDPTFGTFAGYISGRSAYTVPSSDEFYQRTTFDEIFGQPPSAS
jgi:hypothetical protein